MDTNPCRDINHQFKPFKLQFFPKMDVGFAEDCKPIEFVHLLCKIHTQLNPDEKKIIRIYITRIQNSLLQSCFTKSR